MKNKIMKDGIYCKNCNYYITSDSQSSDICIKCGSLERIIHISIYDEIETKELFGGKIRDPNSKFKNHIKKEFIIGDSFSHSTQEWNKISRVIDRENDLYSEVITDNNKYNDIIKSTTEQLSKHTKHGSDKRNNIIEK
ncbi:MAG: hypothetical protein ACYDBX_04625 [Patescibacteria group bacterium]